MFKDTIIGKILNFDKIEAKDPIINHSSFVEPENRDGAIVIDGQAGIGSGHFAHNYNIDPLIRNTKELIHQYRNLSFMFEVDRAIEEIVNDAIVIQSDSDNLVKLGLDKITDWNQKIKDKIVDEFEYIINLYSFDYRADQMFREWYIDGRAAYHIITDDKTKTILELRKLDVRYLDKVRVVRKKQVRGIDVITGYDEYFVYRPSVDDPDTNRYFLNRARTADIQIPIQAVVFAHSGLKNVDGSLVSYLHKSIKPANILKSIEDAAVIYRISRAPERRIFYIDTGNLSKGKAEQYVQGIMTKFKNKITYDTKTGALKTSYDTQSILEDFWLPRKDGNRGTEITTLPNGKNLGEIEDILYFRHALYSSMNVPVGRFDLNSNDKYSVSKPSELDRDELRFNKFIRKLQKKFSPILLEPLKMQCILKGICTAAEWDKQSNNIKLLFNTDSYYEEIKRGEIMLNRLDIFNAMKPGIGSAYSAQFAWQTSFNMTDEEVETQGVKILEEQASGHPRYKKDEQF